MKDTIAEIVFYSLYLFIYGLVIYMFWSYISVLIFAGILSGVFLPVFHFFVNRLRWGVYTSAFCICVLICILVGVPVAYFLSHLIGEAVSLFTNVREFLTTDKLQSWFNSKHGLTDFLKRIFTMLNLEYRPDMLQNFLLDTAKTMSSHFLDTVNTWLSNILYLLWQFIIMLILIFGFLSYSGSLRKFVANILPLPESEIELVFLKFKQINYVTFVTNAIGGIIQGVLAGIAFYIVGIDSPVFWTIFMTFLAFVPIIGISIIYIPASIYLYIFDPSLWKPIFLLIFCTSIALWVEQWFKPKFMGRQIDTNAILILLSIIAGISQFGVLGIFYGPLLISVFFTFIELYQKRKQRFNAQ